MECTETAAAIAAEVLAMKDVDEDNNIGQKKLEEMEIPPLTAADGETAKEEAAVEEATAGTASDEPDKAAETELHKPQKPVEELKSLVGRIVKKRFGRKHFHGTLKSYDEEAGWFKTIYEDGDEEDLTYDEVEPILLEEGASIPEKKKTPRGKDTVASPVSPRETGKRKRGPPEKFVPAADSSRGIARRLSASRSSKRGDAGTNGEAGTEELPAKDSANGEEQKGGEPEVPENENKEKAVIEESVPLEKVEAGEGNAPADEKIEADGGSAPVADSMEVDGESAALEKASPAEMEKAPEVDGGSAPVAESMEGDGESAALANATPAEKAPEFDGGSAAMEKAAPAEMEKAPEVDGESAAVEKAAPAEMEKAPEVDGESAAVEKAAPAEIGKAPEVDGESAAVEKAAPAEIEKAPEMQEAAEAKVIEPEVPKAAA